jgi:S-adenosylmethionine/arginine decarboxylase-like enzyme
MQDLAPQILRQRLVIEGISKTIIHERGMKEYLSNLSIVAGMIELTGPVTHKSEKYGWAGWIHWSTSGAHMYVWDNLNFFSVDIYTCKEFDVQKVIDFTKEFLDAADIVYKEF